MSDLQATLEDVPFTSTSQLAEPAQPTSALFSRGPATPAPCTPVPNSPQYINSNDYNQFAVTYNNWRNLVDTVGLKAAGLPPWMEYVPPNMPTPKPIEVHIPPRAPSRFSTIGNGLHSP